MIVHGCWCSTDYIFSTLKLKREERMLFVPVLFRGAEKTTSKRKTAAAETKNQRLIQLLIRTGVI
jgi:hypothetical protein